MGGVGGGSIRKEKGTHRHGQQSGDCGAGWA